MIGVINNSPQQINAALISMKNELKREIITETIESDVIDDTTISTTKTWSSQKIANETGTVYPEGFIYMQLYNPTSATLEKSPLEMGMTPASGYKWDEITSDFANYPYLKIGSGTTQTGHNAYHNHSGYSGYTDPSHTHKVSSGWSSASGTDRITFGQVSGGYNLYGLGGVNYIENTSINHRHKINYDGDSTEQTVEVNASKMQIWKVVADT